MAVPASVARAADLAISVDARGEAEIREARELVFDAEGQAPLQWSPVSPRLDVESVRMRFADDAAPILLSGIELRDDLSRRDVLLQRYLGRRIELIRPESEQRLGGVLLALKNGRPSMLRTDAGELWLDPAGEVVLPPNPAVVPTPTLGGMAAADRHGAAKVELRYLTGGLKWHARYLLAFDETKGTADIEAALILRNETGIALPPAAWRFFAVEKLRIEAPQPVEEEHLVEYRPLLDTANMSLPADATRRLPLVSARALPVTVHFVFDPLISGPDTDAPAQKLQRLVRIENEATQGALGLGHPLPGGRAKLEWRAASGINRSLGERPLEFTAAGGAIELRLGAADGLQGKRTQQPFVEVDGHRAQEQEIAVHLRNETAAAVQATVVEHPWGRWNIPASSHEPVKVDNETVLFDVAIPAAGEAEVRYRLRIAY